MINKYNVLAIIPARGGSKRIPNKNTKLFCGKPLIAHSIECAKQSKYIDRIIVSTDSDEIASVATSYGAEVPFTRPAEFASDEANDFVVFKHALEWLNKNEAYAPDIVVQLRPTSPLRTVEQLDEAICLLAKHPEADSVRTVTEPEQSPYKMYSIRPDGMLEPLMRTTGSAESFNLPQQALPKVYKHVGYVDVVWLKTIVGKNMMTGDMVLPLILNQAYSGINKPEEWSLYEYIASNKK
jgi:CMP-N,N'-diacetyllegionaminic acid synthase